MRLVVLTIKIILRVSASDLHGLDGSSSKYLFHSSAENVGGIGGRETEQIESSAGVSRDDDRDYSLNIASVTRITWRGASFGVRDEATGKFGPLKVVLREISIVHAGQEVRPCPYLPAEDSPLMNGYTGIRSYRKED